MDARTGGRAHGRAVPGRRPPARAAAAAVAAVLALTAAGCTSPPPIPTGTAGASASAPPAPPPPTAAPAPPPGEQHPSGPPETVATGLDAPWSIVFVDGAPLVSERDTGRILEVGAGGGLREVAVLADVRHGGEGGLLGLALGPGRTLFAYSTGPDGNRIQRFPVTGSPGGLGLGEPASVIDGLPSAGNHNGGRLAFGPDGMLYAGVGDAGQPDRAQDPGFLGGKILRLAPDGSVPADNPLPGSPVFSLGHRNVQGLGWSSDGTMWASEFGQNTWDELNVVRPGANYGWPIAEGIAGDARFVDPVQQWPPSAASPSGLAVAGGTVYLANLRGQVLREVPAGSPGTAAEHFGGQLGRLRDVVLGPDGRLWMLTNNTDGRGDPHEGDDRMLAVPLAG